MNFLSSLSMVNVVISLNDSLIEWWISVRCAFSSSVTSICEQSNFQFHTSLDCWLSSFTKTNLLLFLSALSNCWISSNVSCVINLMKSVASAGLSFGSRNQLKWNPLRNEHFRCDQNEMYLQAVAALRGRPVYIFFHQNQFHSHESLKFWARKVN